MKYVPVPPLRGYVALCDACFQRRKAAGRRDVPGFTGVVLALEQPLPPGEVPDGFLGPLPCIDCDALPDDPEAP